MHYDYADIRALTDKPPSWWDEFGVPRYIVFSPLKLGNIYAKEAVLLRIACQCCSREFDVAMSWSNRPPKPLSELIETSLIHYGDPPNVQCCDGGPTMNSIALEVLEYWTEDQGAFNQMVAEKIPSHLSESEWQKQFEALELSPEESMGWWRHPRLERKLRPLHDSLLKRCP